jgi:branched-chain amino acid transport system substrate-binding protein
VPPLGAERVVRALIDCSINRIETGRFEVKWKVSKEELITQRPPRFDFTRENV